MTPAADNSPVHKTQGQEVFEYVLLTVCLCVIALRATYSEGPAPQVAARAANLGDIVHSLALSLTLLVAFIVWLVWSFWRRTFSYRFTGIEIGFCILVLASIVSGFAAPDKRAAICAVVALLIPILMAILLVQVLDSHSKVKLVLIVIAALGVACAYECTYQFFVTNKMMIAQYEQDPASLLGPLGIEPGSFSQWQFEHRLYSKDIRGFFTTGNSAGSFAIMAAFAVLALVLGGLRGRGPRDSGAGRRWLKVLALVIILVGLMLTHSKGAIAAAVAATIAFIAYGLVHDWLKSHRVAIVVVCLLVVVAGVWAAIWYGVEHGRLPGGNSMLVRWQYWRASAKMYLEHPVRGVGPGNFQYLYPRYKPASAIETVCDPHNFVLAVLAQYGLIGLTGFLAAMLVPLGRIVFSNRIGHSSPQQDGDLVSARSWLLVLMVVSVSVLFLRPIVFGAEAKDRAAVVLYAIFALYVAPAVAFGVGCWLLWPGQRKTGRAAEVTMPALFCAILAVLAHNLIDFAIFEGGVYASFWALMACLIALDRQGRPRREFQLKLGVAAKLALSVGAAIALWAYLAYAFIPVARATAQTKLALGEPQYADAFLAQAVRDDPLDAMVCNLKGRLHLQQYAESPVKESALLKKAEQSFLDATKRNSADFKNFDLLSETYVLLAETTSAKQRAQWLEKAFDSACEAVRRYPGCARLRIDLGEIAEKLGKSDVALGQYQEAVEIEDSYRAQFRMMYPDRELFSRLGEQKYMIAKERIELLSEQTTR